jgi:outer membrane protein OmpA-like peptidoglycan-associated protein
MSKINLVIFIAFFSYQIKAQTNLVPNHSFEDVSKAIKDAGDIEKAVPWTTATAGDPDLFSPKAKIPEVKVPLNTLGEQRAYRGENYAGLVTYKLKDPNIREYLQVPLISPLDSGKTYCVEFYVSLGDLSKYANDGMGAYFSKEKVKTDNWNTLNMVPQIRNPKGIILSDQIDWKIVCGDFVATGGEKFMTIGNFFKDDEITLQKMKKPSSIKGVQDNYGYYYIDEVSVIELGDLGKKDCECEKKRNIGVVKNTMTYVYSKVEQEELIKKSPNEFIENTYIKFAEFSPELTPTTKLDVETIGKVLKSNPNLKFEIIGSAHSLELTKDPDIAKKRAKNVYDVIIATGASSTQIKLGEAKVAESNDKTLPETKELHRKVTFDELVD